MALATTDNERAVRAGRERTSLLRLVQDHYASTQDVRKGICLLNAGRYAEAAAAFGAASARGCSDRSLPSYLAASLAGGAGEAATEVSSGEPAPPADENSSVVRHALSLHAEGRSEEAVHALRARIEVEPDCAELHFQLGTLLTSLDQHGEAELRFSQVLSIDRDHVEAMISLALCLGVRGAPAEAVRQLQRVQALRPTDAQVGFLLAQAGAASKQQGQAVRIRANMPEGDSEIEASDVARLSAVLQKQPDFVDAFLSLPADQVPESVFAALLGALEVALQEHPERAIFHHHHGRVLKRLGCGEDAIRSNERAVAIDPKFTAALVELGSLYAATDRDADAATRLEQAVVAGAEYPDVLLLLGDAYRRQGLLGQARTAYRRALLLNKDYPDAREALAAIPG